MNFTRLSLQNWRNFSVVDAALRERVFVVGPNAAGKSNLLDAFRFLRDIAVDGGGLQKAVKIRGGLSKLRSLAARRQPDVEIDVSLSDDFEGTPKWRYQITIAQETRGHRNPVVRSERVWNDSKKILDRPDDHDKRDDRRLTQTYLEQINANNDFREVAEQFAAIRYMHLVPQLLRFPGMFAPNPAYSESLGYDPFGVNFLETIAVTPEKTKKSRLGRIEKALKYAVPYLTELSEMRDGIGRPHLEAIYEHWRPNAGRQREDQFSDGTLRLIGLLWSILDGDSLLLLEEPELSLNHAIVRELPRVMDSINRWKRKRRQILLSTHSEDLLSSKDIGLEEIIILTPVSEGTRVDLASTRAEIVELLKGGMTPGQAVLPFTEPEMAIEIAGAIEK
jgi:predicted ATPase